MFPSLRRAFVTYDTPLTIPISTLLANDRDPDGDPLTFHFAQGPGAGPAFVQVGSDIVFTPEPGFTGPTGFNYGITDGHGGFANG